MPFNPKIVQDEDLPPSFASEQELPPDLAALAQQLGDDAQQLAAVFPPRGLSAEGCQLRPQPRRYLILPGLGAALVLIAAAVAWQALVPAPNHAPSAKSELADAGVPGASPVDSINPFAADSSGHPLARAATLSVAELSGPELEALADLVGHGADSPASVSF